ncbi:hypothetical protein AK812_SmicGene44220 [Symbiodinium microadriaticum]|uniref:Uncharacterized protein n=1 Tax=Symbiodinium microadriaticum TaxID=2951 RepID=A0A1Q9BZ17_SYMMI|nr:hypothetical protein AK812_SmicGene44220 [Symbiodinium microadriaticum]
MQGLGASRVVKGKEFEEAVLRFKLLEVEHSNKGSSEAAQSNAPQAMDTNYVIAPWVQSIPGPVWNVWDTVEYEYEIWQHEVTSSKPRRKKFPQEHVESRALSGSVELSVITTNFGVSHDSSASASAEDSPPSSAEAVSTSNLELEDECDELPCFDRERLPVVRTFLHFDTRPPCQHRRSKSI